MEFTIQSGGGGGCVRVTNIVYMYVYVHYVYSLYTCFLK